MQDHIAHGVLSSNVGCLVGVLKEEFHNAELVGAGSQGQRQLPYGQAMGRKPITTCA